MNRQILVLILIIAIGTRLILLDVRPMDHDESVHAYLSYRLLKYNQYSYDPAFHGPFLYFSSAALFKIFGDSEFVARIAPAFFSIIGILSACFFERWFGKGVFVFVFLLLFSPSILYYSRYMRNDLILVGSFIVLIYCYFRYTEKRKETLAYISAIFAAIMITSKENGYIYIGTLVSFIFFHGISKEKLGYLSVITKWDFKKLRMVIIFSIIFSLIFVSLYSAGFSDYDGVERATIGAFSHWFTMHEKKDHWKPVYYYTNILLQYEFLPVALSAISMTIFYRRYQKKETTKIELFAVYWLITSFAFYHILAHKVPWLVVHLVLPFAFFGSMYSGSIFDWERRAYRVAFVIIAAATLAVSLNVTYVDYNNADEDLIYIQVQPTAIELCNVIIEKLNSGEKIAVYEPGNDYWPIPWYLRNYTLPFHRSWAEGYTYVVTSEREKSFIEEKGYTVVGSYEVRPNYFMILAERKD
ncbi:MAG TPA: TIGR03663 family protein [Archaeoglobaceae archaeon]|nr:TIGR03663 family protein [Archaeoglobaceae archaeon]